MSEKSLLGQIGCQPRNIGLWNSEEYHCDHQTQCTGVWSSENISDGHEIQKFQVRPSIDTYDQFRLGRLCRFGTNFPASSDALDRKDTGVRATALRGQARRLYGLVRGEFLAD
jgi:hypothetical protein